MELELRSRLVVQSAQGLAKARPVIRRCRILGCGCVYVCISHIKYVKDHVWSMVGPVFLGLPEHRGPDNGLVSKLPLMLHQ